MPIRAASVRADEDETDHYEDILGTYLVKLSAQKMGEKESEEAAELLKSKLMKLNSTHIEFVFDSISKNTTEIRNIKKYLLAVLFNAPSTIDHYYAAQVNHDLYGS